MTDIVVTNCRICHQAYRVAPLLPACPYGDQGPCWADDPRQRAARCTAPLRAERAKENDTCSEG